MKAYKFRPAEQFGFVLDIIFNRRLYCADWISLNDPMEGAYVFSHRIWDKRDHLETVDAISKEQERLHVCSLSKTFDSHLLWAHYADGFKGVAIEVELPEYDPRIVEVSYGGVFAPVSFDGEVDQAKVARKVLSAKNSEWGYEQEVRVLTDERWFMLKAPIAHIIAGHRMEPALFKALQVICEREKIPFSVTGIGDEGIDADYVEPLEG